MEKHSMREITADKDVNKIIMKLYEESIERYKSALHGWQLAYVVIFISWLIMAVLYFIK